MMLDEIHHRERAKSVEIIPSENVIDSLIAWSGVRNPEIVVGYSSE
jgi:hypothetical protein